MSAVRQVITPRLLAASITAIALLAGAPFLIGSVMSSRRLEEARARSAAIAAALRDGGRQRQHAEVLVGPGTIPRFAAGSGWEQRPSAPLESMLDAARRPRLDDDPWRNAYVINAGAAGPMRVLSAGPNGMVETPFEAPSVAGDDVAVTVR